MRGTKAKRIRKAINDTMEPIAPNHFRVGHMIINPKQLRYRKIKRSM